MKNSVPPPQQSISTLTTQQTDTTDGPSTNTSRGLLMLIGITSGTGLVLINILLIACCLHKRHKKNLKGGETCAYINIIEKGIVVTMSCGYNNLKDGRG